MVQITLSDFLDYVSKAGASKLTKVRYLKHRPAYKPVMDFYRPLREAIVAAHRAGGDRVSVSSAMEAVLGQVHDERFLPTLAPVVEGYRSWMGRKKLGWFDPPRVAWQEGDISILVNPDLGLVLDDQPHVIKLWFKDAPLGKRGLDVVFELMSEALGPVCPPDTVVGVLDVRRGRLFTPTVDVPRAGAWLHGEVAYLAAAWQGV